jgi:hypothetical protein
MAEVVEVNDEGNLVLPRRAIGKVQPHTRYTVESYAPILSLPSCLTKRCAGSRCTTDGAMPRRGDLQPRG